ncbi:hypothetical protein P0R33_08415 [Flavobacterium sp. YJ01]|uniref:ABC-three component system protein n=1 Tax=Flavobacterium sp. YJ01 TaxID=3031997 RepID=UPI0023E4164B|nr:ABC-three component system protein [Flavobacterium sp. YJ01]WET04347.1 hypothetical protein P0R33_08415 [Flavobacterium sp. YJ01]
MPQEINNDGLIDQQNNFANVESIYLAPKSKWQRRFEKLQEEVRNDERYESFIDDFLNYNTIQDGIGLEQKLIDANFTNIEIIRALKLKEKYSKRVVKGEMFQAQQEIDVEIFSLVDNNFYAYVFPQIESNAQKADILVLLREKVIQPILDVLNREGEADNFLNYNANDIYGMVYFLTGKCHLNWKNYDII